MPLLALIGIGVVTAYVISVIGPAPRSAPLTPQAQAQLDAAAAASQQAALSAQQSQATLAALQSGQIFQPGFQGQPGASVSGVLRWHGERATDGSKIVYDSFGRPHHLIEDS